MPIVQSKNSDLSADLRNCSAPFSAWVHEILSADNNRQVWLPDGFAHGFVVLSETAKLLYKTSYNYAPAYECCIGWIDLGIGMQWPADLVPIFSADYPKGQAICQAEAFS